MFSELRKLGPAPHSPSAPGGRLTRLRRTNRHQGRSGFVFLVKHKPCLGVISSMLLPRNVLPPHVHNLIGLYISPVMLMIWPVPAGSAPETSGRADDASSTSVSGTIRKAVWVHSFPRDPPTTNMLLSVVGALQTELTAGLLRPVELGVVALPPASCSQQPPGPLRCLRRTPRSPCFHGSSGVRRMTVMLVLVLALARQTPRKSAVRRTHYSSSPPVSSTLL